MPHPCAPKLTHCAEPHSLEALPEPMPMGNTANRNPNAPPTRIERLAVVSNPYGTVRLVSGGFVMLLAVDIGIAGDGGAGTGATVFSLGPIGTAVVTFAPVYEP